VSGSAIDRTHGRWPWLAAALAGPATATAIAQRERLRDDGSWVEWLPLVALFWHQTEEWVWPGGFLPWINRDVLGSQEDEFPITRPLGLAINTGLGWGVGVAAGVSRDPGLSALQLATMAGNVGLHASQAARTGTRNPGLVTAVALFAPLTAAAFPALIRRAPESRRRVAAFAALGAVLSVAMPAVLRLRLKSFGPPDQGGGSDGPDRL
jgi:hypothetical protein